MIVGLSTACTLAGDAYRSLTVINMGTHLLKGVEGPQLLMQVGLRCSLGLHRCICSSDVACEHFTLFIAPGRLKLGK